MLDHTLSDLNVNHGTEILLQFCHPRIGTGRHVCADSFFASVEAAEILYLKGLRFKGVVKTSTRKFPMGYLNSIELGGRGSSCHLAASMERENNISFSLMASTWIDRARRYFITTAGVPTDNTPQERIRWRQSNAEGAYQELIEVKMPKYIHTYYESACQIDRHNRARQADIGLEKSMKVKEWSYWINTSLLSIIFVDSYLVYKGGRGSRYKLSPHEFICTLAHQLIDGTEFESQRTNISTTESAVSFVAELKPWLILAPTNKFRRAEDGSRKQARMQKRCSRRGCRFKTMYVCMLCHDNHRGDVFSVITILEEIA